MAGLYPEMNDYLEKRNLLIDELEEAILLIKRNELKEAKFLIVNMRWHLQTLMEY